MLKLNSNTAIAEAVHVLRSGDLVAFPTETVYGLGADAQNSKALEKLFQLKGRPVSHPVIVHLYDFDQISSWCKVVPHGVQILAKEFWPGPLTIILPRSNKALDLVTGGQDTVGIRIPSHPVARELLRSFGDGIAAPSANKFGRLSPTSAEHVRSDLGDYLKVILDGGRSQVGIESTIVDFSGQRPQILRPGMIDAGRIADVIGLKNASQLNKCDDAIRVSGALPSHYAPKTPLKLLSIEEIATLTQTSESTLAVLSFHPAPDLGDINNSCWLQAKNEPVAYARDLYENIRQLDGSGATAILVESLPDKEEWSAIQDRLSRAAN